MTGAVVTRGRAGLDPGKAVGFLGRQREITLVLIIVLLGAAVTIFKPDFLSARNLNPVFALAAIIAVAAVGEALVIITKNVDLAIESIIGLVAFVVADLLAKQAMSVPMAWVFGLGLGLLCGIGTGLVVTVLKVPSIVAGLGMLSIYRGIDYFVANGHEVNLGQLPPGYSDPATEVYLGIPLFVWIAIAVVVVVAALLRLTRFGRSVYAVGSNAEAAGILGIRSGRVIFAVFAIEGLLGGLAGIMWGIYFGTIYASSGSGLALQIIASVVVGGVAIAGGSGTVVGAALGALFLGLINNAILVLLLPQELLQAIYGAVIIVAVSTDAIIRRRSQRDLARARVR